MHKLVFLLYCAPLSNCTQRWLFIVVAGRETSKAAEWAAKDHSATLLDFGRVLNYTLFLHIYFDV